ncbi:MAG: YDG domain-containing protein, partial [Desulfuromonadaceae bacterium]|nr:YDG domain-containing protein [Desulfuromonadaceae bacterium]
TGQFLDKNVGSGKIVTVSGSVLSGLDSGNYNLIEQSGLTADINKADLTVSGLIAENKTYDSSTSATLSGSGMISPIGSDDVTLSGTTTGQFLDKNVGSGKIVTVSGSVLSGLDSGNYNLIEQSGLTADISRKELAITAAGVDKIYDGTTQATVILTDDRVSGDVLDINGVAGFMDKNVGENKTVNVMGITLSGSDAQNYSFSTDAKTTADIAVRPISTWSGMGGDSRWSNPDNWDALPDYENVLAVSIPAAVGGHITFDSGSTTLNSLDVQQDFVMENGSLNIIEALKMSDLQQTGGSITGSGTVDVTNSFNQLGGSIDIAGTATLTQLVGDMNIASLKAPVVVLTAETGRITQTGSIVTSDLTTHSATGTILNSANKIAKYTADNSLNGDIVLINKYSTFTVASITNSGSAGSIRLDNYGATNMSGNVESKSGYVTVTAHSPLTVYNDVTAYGDVTLVAGSSGSLQDNLLIKGNVSSINSNVILKAGNAVEVTGKLSAPNGKISITDNLNGGSFLPEFTTQSVAQIPIVNEAINSFVAIMNEDAVGNPDEEDELITDETEETNEGEIYGTKFQSLPSCNN